MLSHEEMISLQAEQHDLIDTENFNSIEEYILHLKHRFAYVQASTLIRNKKVLDVGCNTGYGSAMMAEIATQVAGVDVSERAIIKANLQYNESNLSFKVVDGKKLPFDDYDFDVVVSFQVIEHIVNYNLYFNELKRVLSSQGIILFTTPNKLIRLDPGMKPWNKYHVREFDHFELKSLLSRYFSGVIILGLFAKEPLYSIDIKRNRIIRENARKPTIVNKFKAFSSKNLDKIFNFFSPKSTLGEEYLISYNLDDFEYMTRNLGKAMNLMAVCSLNNQSLIDAKFNMSL